MRDLDMFQDIEVFVVLVLSLTQETEAQMVLLFTPASALSGFWLKVQAQLMVG